MSNNIKWETLLNAIIQSTGFGTVGFPNKVLIWSVAPGTGKSTAARNAAKWLAQNSVADEPIEVTMHRRQDVSDIIGTTQLKDGSTYFSAETAALAMENGSPLIIDEVDQFSPAVETIFNAVLDDWNNAVLACPGGKRIKPAPGFSVIGTTNAHPSELPERFRGRFDAIIHADTVSAGLLEAVGPALAEMLEAAHKSRGEKHYFAPMAPRRALALCAFERSGIDKRTALQLAFGTDAEMIDALEASLTMAGTQANPNS